MTLVGKSVLHVSFVLAVLFLPGVPVFCAQSDQPRHAAQVAPLAAAPSTGVASYPDNEKGLKQLASDIVKAQEQADSVRAAQLLDSLVIPNFREWYAENFIEPAVARVLPAYTAAAPRLPAQLAQIFLSAHQEGFRGVEAVRYPDEQSACSSPPVFSAMTTRRTQVPLYELRFTHGDRFRRVFAFAYVDGAFRIVLVPDFTKSAGQTSPRAIEPGPKEDSEPGTRVPMGATVQAAKLICRVQPYYPEDARRAHISGTVRLHAIIGRDGSIKQLEVLSGPNTLATAARAAVSRWRYRPTLINGEPVEVDTTIDVIFSLSY